MRETEDERGDGEDLEGRLRALETQYAETRRSLDDALAAPGRTGSRTRRLVRRGLPPHSERALHCHVSRLRGSFPWLRSGDHQAPVRLPAGSGAGCQSGGVVDVGPGRGEWLTLLHDRGIPAYGVETHPRFVDACRTKGLTVIQGDAIAHLWELPLRDGRHGHVVSCRRAPGH